MLKSLLIDNYALIEKLEISFQKGFSVITGETGAGKSIILGALALLLGRRADHNVLANKNKKCIVEGIFDIELLGMEGYFKENDLDYDRHTLIRREILPSGRSRAFINDTPVNLSLLKFLGDRMVDVHSQHETLMLGQSGFQLQALDSFIGKPDRIKTYQKVFADYSLKKKVLENLIVKNDEAKRDEDYQRFLYEELMAAQLVVEEYEKIREREKFLVNAEEVIRSINQANQLLSEDDESLLEKVENLRNVLSKAAPFLEGIQDLESRIDSLSIEMKDVAGELSRLDQLSDFDPQELMTINERLDLAYRLQQKHGARSVAELINIQDNLAIKLDTIDSKDEEIESLGKELEELQKKLRKLADGLSALRDEQSRPFAKAVKRILSLLGMEDASFVVNLFKLEKFNANGTDRISFSFSANKGGEMNEISRIASGGELSRLMLAIKSLITKEQLLPTVVFDEIDSGVSGDIAGKVGNILKAMSGYHQLIVISHLPQIAAKADHHYKVYKEILNDRTFTQIRQLEKQERVEEIAKILSDERITEAAMRTAKELLSF